MTRAWRWVNAVTRQIDDVDFWWLITDYIKNNFPTTWSSQEMAKPIEKRHLLAKDIGWGISGNNFKASKKQATFIITHNNSPQRTRWIGGTRRTILQFVVTEFTFRHKTKSNTDMYNNPPWRFMATKNIFEHMLSANSEVFKENFGIVFVANPSVIQDGKNFGNFGLFQTPMNLIVDNNEWKYVLLWQMKILEDLT